MARRPDHVPPELKRRLDETHRGLLRVHKALLDYERTRFEAVNGKIPGPGEFLQLVINDPFFAWLRPVSEFVVQIDEYTESKEPVDAAAGEALLVTARRMLVPSETGDEFQRNYHRALAESPEVGMAHGEWKQMTND
jgi:hypothetical protein